MANEIFYPSLSSLLSVNKLPNNLGFLQGITNNIFDTFFYRNLQTNVSRSGDRANYSLILVNYSKVGFEIPGTGISLLFNPTIIPDTGSEIQISVSYEWEILRYVHNFDVSLFDGTLNSFFNLISSIANVNRIALLKETVVIFIGNSNTASFDTFVSNYNLTNQNNQITVIPDVDSEIYAQNIIDAFDAQSIDVFQTVFDEYIFDIDENILFKNIEKLFFTWLGFFSKNRIQKLLIPQVSASIYDINLALEFPRSVLKPIDPATNEAYIDENIKSLLRFTAGSIHYNTELGLRIENENSFDFTKSEILNTGITLEFDDLKVDLSSERNIPEATADGRPNDFIGVFAENVSIGLPQKWFKQASGATLEIFGEKVIIGTGGFSGIVGLRAIGGGAPPSNSELVFNLNGTNDPTKGFQLGFKEFFLKFERNSILESSIKGSLTFPDNFTDSNGQTLKVDIEAHFFEDGDFSITASEDNGISAKIDGAFEVIIKELEVGRVDDEIYLETKGELKIINPTIAEYIEDPIQIKKLRIWDDGKIEFVGGGSLVLPEPKSVKVGPVELSVTAIHIGSHEQYFGGNLRKYAYIGFDGGINVNPGGVDARGDGIKFYFTIDNASYSTFDFFIRIESIAIDLIIPGSASPEQAAVLLSGYLSMKQPDSGSPNTGTEYIGGVSIALPKANISGSAAMRLNPKIPSFLIDLSLELPVPITLGPTGLGIYGFRGLLGQRYVASQEEIGAYDWWDYYKKKVSPDYREGIQPSKFAQESGFSVGAGVSLATVEPSGGKKAFTSKIFFMLSMPDVLLIQGQAAIVKEHIGLDVTSDPPFSAMLAIDSQSVTTAFGVNYKIPDTNAKILKLDALLEMGFFYNDPSAWYVNVGTSQNPVQGKIFKDVLNINAYAYLMLYSSGLETGAGISFNKTAKAGPLKAVLSAYIDIYGKINYVPIQIGAGMSLGGTVVLKIWKFGTTLTASASIAAEIPEPFVVSGSVKACIKVLKKNRCIKFPFTWIFDNTINTSEIALHSKGKGAAAKNVMSKETYELYAHESTSSALPSVSNIPTDCVIPVDSKIDIEFLKPVDTTHTANFGVESSSPNNTEEKVPKKKGKLEPATHNFSVEEVKIYYNNSGTWQPYNVFQAIQPQDTSIISSPPLNANYGYWQLDSAGKVNKLSVLARSPIEWLRNGSTVPNLGDFNLNTQTEIYCPEEEVAAVCVNHDNYPNTSVPVNSMYNHDGLWFKLIGSQGNVESIQNQFGLNNALVIEPGDSLEIYFPDPIALTRLSLLANVPSVTVSYYKRTGTGTFDINSIQIYSYDFVHADSVPLSGMILPIEYEDELHPFDKIVIEPDTACTIDCTDFQTQMSSYVSDTILQLQTQQDDLELEIIDHQYHCANSPDPLFAGQNCALVSMKTQQIADIQQIIDNLNSYLSVNISCFLLQENQDNILLENGTDGILLEANTCCESEYPCGAYVFGVCWLTVNNYSVPDITPWTNTYESVTAMIDALQNTVEPIWRPEGEYLIHIKTVDDVDLAPNPYERYFNYGFRTKGPLGHFHQHDDKYSDLVTLGKEDEYKLAKLKDYIDVQRSYPNADGNIINAKPLFYKEAKLRMLFKYPYVYTMYSDLANYSGMPDIHSNLDIIIKDPQSQDLIPYANTQWNVSEATTSGVDVEILNNFMNGQNCVQATNFEQLNVGLAAEMLNLKPSKLYTAIYKASYGIDGGATTSNEVHQYPFQTSRYGCFAEQVYSFLTFEEEDIEYCNGVDINTLTINTEAFYDVLKDFTSTNIADAADVLANSSSDALVRDFSHAFDRLLDGALKLEALDTAETTEFNMLWKSDGINPANDRLIGIIVRNPEPFNNPKITDAELEQSIQIVNSSGNVNSNYKVIISKDRSEAFISNDALDITDSELLIRFRYLEYDEANAVYDLLSASNEVTINLRTIAETTELSTAYCNATELGLRDIIEANVVNGAYAYEFLVEHTASGFSQSYLRNNIDAKLPLYEIAGLEYNKQYSIKVRPLISGRRTVFGNVCNITTKALTFTIINPIDNYVGQPINVKVKVLDGQGNLATDFNTDVTLNTTGSATGAGLIDIVNGVGIIQINDDVAETVTLSLTDSENTGINIGATQDVEFMAIIASKFVILDTNDAEQGSSVSVTIEAQNIIGLLDTSFSGSVTLETTGSAIIDNSGLVTITNGIGTIDLTNDVAETIILSLNDTASTGLDVSSSIDITFTIQSATKFVIIDPLDAPEETYVDVEIQAQNDFGNIDTNFNIGVTLLASGSGALTITNNGIVNIQNGVGSTQIYSDIPQTVTLTLDDTESTGLDVSSMQYVVFVMTEGIAFQDNFTESAGTTLGNHTPDIGESWTKIIQINSGTLKVETTDDTLVPGTGGINKGILYSADILNGYTNADYIVEVKQIQGGTGTSWNYIAARIQDSDNMYLVKFNKASSELIKIINGVSTVLNTGSGTSNSEIVKFEVIGNKLKFYENYEDNILYFIDTDITDAGKAGLGMGDIGNGGKMIVQEFDNFAVRFGGDLNRVFLDKFTNSGPLEDNMPEEGNLWTQVINIGSSQGIKIQNGIARKTSNGTKSDRGSFYIANVLPDYQSSNYEVELKIVSGHNSNNTISLGVRVQNTGDDGYFVRFNNSESRLYKRIGGVWTVLGTTNGNGISNGSIVRLRINGSNLEFESDGYIILSETDTDITAIGEAGFGFGALMVSNDDEKHQKVDNFVIRKL